MGSLLWGFRMKGPNDHRILYHKMCLKRKGNTRFCKQFSSLQNQCIIRPKKRTNVNYRFAMWNTRLSANAAVTASDWGFQTEDVILRVVFFRMERNTGAQFIRCVVYSGLCREYNTGKDEGQNLIPDLQISREERRMDNRLRYRVQTPCRWRCGWHVYEKRG